ncbi:nucleotide exchange factor GrpE [Staphylococcus auricularis]|uniref:nucleotide exchange factor GrpE n=1 Tax=Staphylococcus auricularis TaxID=29379 RepID=UPI001EF2D596|nr:nucleotide exchange factor GrpE [Staphylococcus auricularis]MCG7341004.1 nucleotide exchange factor GrpE [Staphylococcus auricularis]
MAETNESVNNQTDEQQTEAESVEETEQTANTEEATTSEQTEDTEDTASETNEDNQNDDLQDENEQEDVDPKDEEIQQLKDEVKENEEKYLRLYAEFDNYKRRIQKENQTMKTYQAQNVLTDILPTIDNIERALQIEGDTEQFNSLQKGVQMVYDSLLKALKDNGLEVIETEGQQFDPNFHQAVMQDDNSEYESGQITQELQKGYKLKERVLRPSMVKVNQ